MIDTIKESINDPEKLERLYRSDKKSFESDLEKIFSGIENSELAKFWKIRLDYDKTADKINKISGSDLVILISSCLIVGFLIKIPALFNINLSNFLYYEKNAGIIFFLGLTIYSVWTKRILEQKQLIVTLAAFLIAIIYINLLPSIKNSDSINLAYFHLPVILWCIYGWVYNDFNIKDKSKISEFIRYNGDLTIQLALIAIAGAILTGITLGLFKAIGLNIEKFYFNNIVIVGLVSAPIVATFIVKNFPGINNKLAPIIANIFSPLVLITLIIYLIAIAYSGKDPYNDRNFLLIFNVMLIGVMAIIVFSVSEASIIRKQKFNEIVLLILSIVTLLIDLIVLSAIFYRLGTFGVSPNRIAIFGSNILIFVNLILITIDLFRINFKKAEIQKVELTISKYIPVYMFWALIVVFGFPLIFGIK